MHPMRNGRFILQNAQGSLGKYAADALLARAHTLPNGGLAWYYPRHYSVARMMGSLLKYSAISQGTILSGYIGLSKHRSDVDPGVAKKVFDSMTWPFEKGGVNMAGKAVLEMPSFKGPPEIVLNGWLDALIHIRDYAMLSNDEDAKELFVDNVAFLSEVLPVFDYEPGNLSLYSDLSPYRVNVTVARPKDLDEMSVLYTPRFEGFDPILVPLQEMADTAGISPYENQIVRKNGRKAAVWLSCSQLFDTILIAHSNSLELSMKSGIYHEQQATPGLGGHEIAITGQPLDAGVSFAAIPREAEIFRGYPTNFAKNKVINFYHAYHVVALMLVAMGEFVTDAQRRTLVFWALKWQDYMRAFENRDDIRFNDLQDILTKLNGSQSRVAYDDYNQLLRDASRLLHQPG